MSHTVITTPEGMTYFHLAQLKGAIQLEELGMRHSSGRSSYAFAKRTYGFSGTRKMVIEQIKTEMAKILAKRAEAEVMLDDA